MSNEAEVVLTDEDILRLTQGTRKRLLDDIIKNGIPTDKDERELLLSTLNDMDRTALGNKRIGAAEKMAGADRLVSEAIIRITSQFGTANPFQGQTEAITIPSADVKQLPAANPVPGETGVGLELTNFDEFIDKFEKDS